MTSTLHNIPEYTDDELWSRCPYYMRFRDHLDDPLKNIRFRREILRLVRENREFAEVIWIMCSRDILFYTNVFGWTYTPKDKYLGKFETCPFITWDFQVHCILRLLDSAVEGFDLACSKSRDMGATWMCLIVIAHQYAFGGRCSAGVTSRNESLVDTSGDMDALLPKLDFWFDNQPSWIKPATSRTYLKFLNKETGATIRGASTTSEAFRGGRLTILFNDEFDAVNGADQDGILAATRDAVNCRIFNSTPGREMAGFYRQCRNPETMQLRIHWTAHPLKSKGLYHADRAGNLILDDLEYWIARANAIRPDDTPKYTAEDLADVKPDDEEALFDCHFIRDGKHRSPWYDKQCRRAKNPVEIARELDIDWGGAGSMVFPEQTLVRCEEQTIQEPKHRGRLDYDLETGRLSRFVADHNGPLFLWCDLDNGRPDENQLYAMGIDISAGTGAANSSAAVGVRGTGEQVAELTIPTLSPHAFATYCYALSQFFGGRDNQPAYLCWEANGSPGASFSDQIINLQHPNFYWRRDEKTIKKKQADYPGFWTTGELKEKLLRDYLEDLNNNAFTLRSGYALNEHRAYRYGKTGVEYVEDSKHEDLSGAKSRHGDRVIALGLLSFACRVNPVFSVGTTKKEELPYHSFGARRERHRQKMAAMNRSREAWWHRN